MSFRGTGGLEIRFEGEEALDITPFVRSFSWVESMILGGFSWEIQLSTEFWAEWNSFILGREAPKFRLKFQGSDGTRSHEESTEWRTAVVDKSRVSYRSTALVFWAAGADMRLEMLQKDRTRAWPNSSVSSVVNTIGAEYGLNVLSERTVNLSDRWQARETDWNFMRSMVASASSGSGRGDYYLWLDERTLNLRAPQLQQLSDRRHAMHEMENRVDRIVLSYHGREVDRQGGATLVGVGVDLDTKTERVFTLDAARAATQPALARRLPRAQGDGLRVMTSLATTADGVEETVRGRWGDVAPRYFALRVDSRPDLALKPGMVVDIQNNLSARQDTPFMGRFAVLEVQHKLTSGSLDRKDDGGLVTTAVCFRREAYDGDSEPTGASVAGVGTRDRYSRGQDPVPRTVVVAEVLE